MIWVKFVKIYHISNIGSFERVRETVSLQTSDIGKKTLSVLVY